MSLLTWLKSLIHKEKEGKEEFIINDFDFEEDCNNCECDCIVVGCKDLNEEEQCNCDDCQNNPNEHESWLKALDWNDLEISVFEYMMTFDLHEYCDDLVNWYKISKFIDLPDEFCIKYRDKILWNEYNKRYLTKKVKELLKSEGRI